MSVYAAAFGFEELELEACSMEAAEGKVSVAPPSVLEKVRYLCFEHLADISVSPGRQP